MRKTAAILAFLLVAGVASAQERPRSDYSKNSLLRLFAEAGTDEEDARAFRVGDGMLQYRGGNTSVGLLFRPVLAFSGSTLTTDRTYPDPFSLTGTQIATGPHAWHTVRETNAELRRIEETDRARIRVVSR
jgi:hypothetical protein